MTFMTIEPYSSFTEAKDPEVKNEAKPQHPLSRIHLPGSSKTWIKKETKDAHWTRVEIMANEFFRLIVEGQVETRLLVDPKSQEHYVVSEEILGFKGLPGDWVQGYVQGTYKGLGQIMACALFLQEVDLKNGNVGLDEQNRFQKIDGEFCFGSLNIKNDGPYCSFSITKETIGALPTPYGFFVENWLDEIQQGSNSHQGSLSFLSNDKDYRAEVNEALFGILLLPESFFKRFVAYYMPDPKGRPYFDFFIRFQKEYKDAALQDLSFCKFLQSANIDSEFNKCLDRFTSFRVNDAPLLSTEDQTIFRTKAQVKFSQLTKAAPLVITDQQPTTMQLLMKMLGSYVLNPRKTTNASNASETDDTDDETNNEYFFDVLTDRNLSFSTLLHAANEGNINLVSLMITQNKELLTQRNIKGQTVIMYAARGGHLEIVHYLLEKGGSKLLRQQDKDGNTVLLSTLNSDMSLDSFENHFKEEGFEPRPQDGVLDWLLAKCNAEELAHKDKSGWNVLAHAVKSKDFLAIRVLVQRGIFEFATKDVATAQIIRNLIQDMDVSDFCDRQILQQLYYEAKRKTLPLEWFRKIPRNHLDTFDFERKREAANFVKNIEYDDQLPPFNQQESEHNPHHSPSYVMVFSNEDNYLNASDKKILIQRQALFEEHSAIRNAYIRSFETLIPEQAEQAEQAQPKAVAPQPQLLWSQLDDLSLKILTIEKELCSLCLLECVGNCQTNRSSTKKSRPADTFFEAQRAQRKRSHTSVNPVETCSQNQVSEDLSCSIRNGS